MWRNLVASLALFAWPSLASNDYTPLSAAERSRRFPLKPARGINFDEGSETVSFRGKDKAGNAWSVYAYSNTPGRLYQGDLDRNGEMDLVFIAITGGAGMAPGQRILFLCFDTQGRPVTAAFEADTAFDDSGIEDMLDLDRNGQAEFLRQELSDGYWVTTLYEFREGRIHLVRTAHAGRTYPLYTRFTNKLNNHAVTPKAPRNPRASDLSNNVEGGAAIRLSRIEFEKSGLRMWLHSDAGEKFCVHQFTHTFMITIDDAATRRSATIGLLRRARPLLDEIVRKGYAVRLSGQRFARGEPGGACVESIWADGKLP